MGTICRKTMDILEKRRSCDVEPNRLPLVCGDGQRRHDKRWSERKDNASHCAENRIPRLLRHVSGLTVSLVYSYVLRTASADFHAATIRE